MTRLGKDEDVDEPVWSPDGSQIVFARSGHRARPDGSGRLWDSAADWGRAP